MKNFIKKNPKWSAFFILLIIVAFFVVAYYFLKLADSQKSELNLTYYVLALFATGLVILIGYLKSEQAIQQSRTNYLLRIDERWSSPEIIRAREVIHELYLDAEERKLREDKEDIYSIIGKSIMKLHDDKKSTEEFIKLLNFLDFLETIGFLYSRDSITAKETNELIGNSIIYFYEIFKLYIENRRKKDPNFYTLFERLYTEVKKYQILQSGLVRIKSPR